jgi:hypothetical protein
MYGRQVSLHLLKTLALGLAPWRLRLNDRGGELLGDGEYELVAEEAERDGADVEWACVLAREPREERVGVEREERALEVCEQAVPEEAPELGEARGQAVLGRGAQALLEGEHAEREELGDVALERGERLGRRLGHDRCDVLAREHVQVLAVASDQ